MHTKGSAQVICKYYTILHEGFECLQILVSVGSKGVGNVGVLEAVPMDTERQLLESISTATLGVTSILILQMRTQVWRKGQFLPEVTHQAK